MSAFSVSLIEIGYGSYPLTLLERVVHMACAQRAGVLSGFVGEATLSIKQDAQAELLADAGVSVA